MHALAADVGADAFRAGADLVDFVEEHDAVLLHHVDGVLDEFVLVQKFVALFGNQDVVGIADRHAALGRLLAEGLAEDVVEIDHAHARAGHAGDVERGHRGSAGVRNLEFDFLVLQFPFAQLLPECLARAFRSVLAHERIEDAVLCRKLGARHHLLAALFALQVNRDLDEIADDLFDVAADIADLREFCRLHLDEGCVRQARQAAGNFPFCRRPWGRSSGCSSGVHRRAGHRAVAGDASGCEARWRRRAWRRAAR